MIEHLRRGPQTTEFWLAALAMFVGISLVIIPDNGPWAELVGSISVTLASMGYSISRGKAKGRP